MFTVRILKPAVRELKRLDKSVGRRVAQRIQWLSQNLHAIQPIPLKGPLAGLYKLREGDYRVIYQILHQERVILIHTIGHRREIYRS
jgi:mRNA interferase RelE/StbE